MSTVNVLLLLKRVKSCKLKWMSHYKELLNLVIQEGPKITLVNHFFFTSVIAKHSKVMAYVALF